MYKSSKNLDKSAFLSRGGSLTSRTLLAALLLGITPAMAAELADVDLSKIPLNKPTLDYLHENNVQIPQTEYDDEGNLIESGSILAPESAYTLTEVPAGADGAAPVGDNIITKFEYNASDGSFSPKYYQLNLKQTTYGEGNQSYTVTLENSPVKDIIINVLYDNTNTSERITVDSGTDYGDITSNFIGNSAGANGGAIYNRGTISDITGNFIANSADYDSGAIYNGGTIGNITGDFIGNYGGAIYNDYNRIIGIIAGNFIANSGNAIYNSGIIGDITGDFIGNNSSGNIGGAIYNNVTIGDITGNFIGNSANGGDYYGNYGGAIYNIGEIGDITGDFIGNYANGRYADYGGAIYNEGTITNINGDFIKNDASSGSAIYNTNTIGTITGDFIGNTNGVALSNSSNLNLYSDSGTIAVIDKITGNFINNTSGAIENTGYINEIKGNFINNEGGAISSSFYSAYRGHYFGAPNIPYFDTTGINKIVNSNFYNNFSKEHAGAIYSNRDINIVARDGGASVFSGNYIQSQDGNKDYVAIFIEVPNFKSDEWQSGYYKILSDSTTLTLNANTNGTIIIDDKISGASNFVDGNFTEEYNPETGSYDRNWIDENGNPVDEPEKMTYSVNITGDNTGKVILNNTVDGYEYEYNYSDNNGKHVGNILGKTPVNISLENTNLYLGARDNIFDGNNLNLKSGFMSMVNNSAGISALNNLTVSGDVNFAADVDLANKEMDRFTAAEYGEHTGNINVIGMNLLSDAVEGESVTAVYFAEPDLKNNVVNAISGGTGELPDSFQTTAYTPIYKYNVIYDKDNQYDGKGDGGYFVFAKGDIILPDEPDEPDEPNLPIPPTGGGTTGNPSDAFNPAVLATPVGNLAAGQAAMNEAFKYVFEHADAFTQLPAMERYAKINANKYALSTDFNDNLQSYADQLHNNAVWFRPYTTFETMNIKNGPKVDAITYGSLVGFDGDFKEMKNGWSRVFTGYAGYMGSSLNYSGVDTTMNGGLLGFTETFYKGNFWTAITASAGASVGESHTMYGKEDYTSLLAGVGSKTGYNFEFKDGKFIIQPIMFLSYTFVNTFDYKNAAGVSIESDPLHTIQLNPSVRFIANLKGGWQPYASVGMVWNLMNESKVTANNVKLPEMSVKPYVEYGVGVQRNWADKFTAFLQAMIRNGGRNGIALTGGFRFMLGSDNDNSDKPKVKKEIKSL